MADYQLDKIEAARRNIEMLDQAYAEGHITQEECNALKLLERNIIRAELGKDPV